MKLHSTANYFICSQCDKHFRIKKYLLRHKNTHLGVKKFVCDICETSFPRKDSFLRHKRNVHSTKDINFRCHLCDTHFSRIDNLARHKLKKTLKLTLTLCHSTHFTYYSTVINSLINCNYYRILSFSILFINQMILTLTPVNLAKDVSRSFDILKWVIGTLKPVTSQWSRLSRGLTSRVVSPLMWSHLSCGLTSRGTHLSCGLTSRGTHLSRVRLSCGLTSQGFASQVGSPLMWSHLSRVRLSCGLTSHVGSPPN